jgi:nucleotide-binding universal stress UspA family protein
LAASVSGSQATLLHVIERIEGDGSRALAGFYRRLERSSRQRMKAFLGPFAARGLAVKAEVIYGKTVEEILRFAQLSRADLIVMSSHKLPRSHRGESWGTVSYKVGILSRCPVLLVK